MGHQSLAGDEGEFIKTQINMSLSHTTLVTQQEQKCVDMSW